MKHENQVVVVLERLNLHARDRLHVILGLLIVEPRNLVFHEACKLHVERRVAFTDAFDHALEVVFIQLREFREAVVGEQVREFLGVAAVVLIVHGHFLRAHEQCRFEPSVAAHDEPAALAHRDRPAPALLLDNRGQELDLMRAMPVRVFGIRLQGRRINESIVCAVDFHDTRRMSKFAYVVGVDGCPFGWFAVWSHGCELVSCAYESFAKLWNAHCGADRILVDIPIGLPMHVSQYPRECDVEAQACLAHRSCTVFRVPLVASLTEPEHAAASSLHRRLTSKGISRQVHSLREKLIEVNSFLADTPAAQAVVAESHPELCFLALHGSPVSVGKKKPEGLFTRLSLLKNEDARSGDLYEAATAKYTRNTVSRDDILDALVLFFAARKSLISLTEKAAFGLHGLPMRILIPDKT